MVMEWISIAGLAHVKELDQYRKPMMSMRIPSMCREEGATS